MDIKIVERIKKLLALSRDSGATEAEAALAAEKAAEIMEEHGLTTAAVELSGGVGESREKGDAGVVGLGREDWALTLMEAVAESCFCWAGEIRSGRKLTRFNLIGRSSAVVSCQVMYEYLSRTVIRLSRREHDSQRYFRFGCAERIAQRLRTRHSSLLREQREREEARERASHSSAANGDALVVILEDYETKERDLNADFRRGVAPGTTARERAEIEERTRVREAHMKELTDSGIEWDIAWWMVYQHMTLDQAKMRDAQWKKSSGGRRSYRERVDWDERRRSTPSYQRGKDAGENVGLDTQVGSKKRDRRRITE